MPHQPAPSFSFSPRIKPAKVVRPRTVLPGLPDNWSDSNKKLAREALEIACDLAFAKLTAEPRRWEADDRRYVILWDTVEWSVAFDGTQFWCKPATPGGEFFYPTSDLTMPVSRLGWPAAFGDSVKRACNAVSFPLEALRNPIGDWIRRGMRKTFEDFIDWNALRRDALDQLRLHPLNLALHSRIFIDRHVGLETFNWVKRYLPELSLVAVERPQLLPFLSFACRLDGDPVGEFEKRLNAAGITPAGRRWMERVGFNPFLHATEFGTHKNWPDVLSRYANLLARLEIHDPPEIFTAMVTTDCKDMPDWFHRGLFREINRLMDELGLEDPEALPERYEDVVRWMREMAPTPDENQRRGGWAWMQTQACRFMIAKSVDDPEPWECAYPEFVHEGLTVKPIASIRQLRQEALAMRNCLEVYGSACMTRLAQPFIVFDALGKRVACLMLHRKRRDQPWEILEVAGRMNSRASDAAVRAAAVAKHIWNGAAIL